MPIPAYTDCETALQSLRDAMAVVIAGCGTATERDTAKRALNVTIKRVAYEALGDYSNFGLYLPGRGLGVGSVTVEE